VPGLVADLVQRKVDVVVLESTLAALAAKRATATVPIVMAIVSDPVGSVGGRGSGNRWRYNARSTTDDYRTLDVRRCAREGMLTPGYWGGWQWTRDGETVASIQMRAEQDRVILIYRHRSGGGEWKDEQYPVRIVRTPCNLGSSRAWFLCPAVGCGRRVAILYGGGVFACRRCYQLAYASSREDAGERATRRADRLRERLGWKPGILNGGGEKPKWMRWRTFDRLTEEHDQLVRLSMWAVALKFGLLERGFLD
jgi:hypothetical protein